MRQIKFRAWDPDHGEWIQAFDVDRDGLVWYNHVGLVNAILNQSTGLQDANGNDIYEGDILQHGGNYTPPLRELVKWEENEWREDGFYTGYLLPFTPDQYTIIGNIHQNPELVEKPNE